jgi:hypothetical protein
MNNYKIIFLDAIEGKLKLIQGIDLNGVVWTIPEDPANSEYQKYLTWVADGNEPEQQGD